MYLSLSTEPISCFTVMCKDHPILPHFPQSKKEEAPLETLQHLRGAASDEDKESHK